MSKWTFSARNFGWIFRKKTKKTQLEKCLSVFQSQSVVSNECVSWRLIYGCELTIAGDSPPEQTRTSIRRKSYIQHRQRTLQRYQRQQRLTNKKKRIVHNDRCCFCSLHSSFSIFRPHFKFMMVVC